MVREVRAFYTGVVLGKMRMINGKSKIAAGVALLAASLGFFLTQMPSAKDIEEREDKPRAPAPAPAAAPVPSAIPVVGPKPAPPGPVAAPAQLAGTAESLESLAKPARVDWALVCAAESGLLCYQVPETRLPRCLARYESRLLKACRSALRAHGYLDEE